MCGQLSWGVRIGLLGDTHGFLDPAIFDYFSACDEVWHAGDFGPVEIMDRLAAFKPLRGVWGNIDGTEIRASLPKELKWECAGLGIYMTHIAGYPGSWDKRAKAALARLRPGLVICGHSHILKVMRDQQLSLIHLNPGAAGHNGWHSMRTVLRFEVEEGRLHNLEAIELGPRGRIQSEKGTSRAVEPDQEPCTSPRPRRARFPQKRKGRGCEPPTERGIR